MDKISQKLFDFLFPILVGIGTYMIAEKFFPEDRDDKIGRNLKKANNKKADNPETNLRGGADFIEEAFLNEEPFLKRLAKKILSDKSLKLALISVFAAAGIRFYSKEIIAVLMSDLFKKLPFDKIPPDKMDETLKIVYNIINEHELNLHSKTMQELILKNNLSTEEKVNLMKIKLDAIINCDFSSKSDIIIMLLLSIIITVSVSGIGGLSLFLTALYKLFKEGKITPYLYKQILKNLRKQGFDVPDIPFDDFC